MYSNNRVKTSIWHKIGLILFGLALIIIFIELGLRLSGFIFLSLQEYANRLSIRQKDSYRIMCLGESTTARQWPPILQEVLNSSNTGRKFSVIDKGIPAVTTEAILLRLEDNLNIYKPDMVIAMMGFNDRFMVYYKDVPETPAKLFRHCRLYGLIKFVRTRISKKINNDSGYIGSGQSYRNRGKFARAEGSLKKAIAFDPKSDAAYVSLGWLYQEQGKYLQAEQVYRKAIEINPESDKAYGSLGRLYHEQGEFVRAEEAYKKAMGINPVNDAVYGGLAVLYEETGNPVLSKEYDKKANELRSQYYSAVTVNNYRKLKEVLDKRGTKLVCVQYPMRRIDPLKKVFEGQGGIIFVDNEAVFKEAVKRSGYKEYFTDMIGGDFGHCTPKGNRLLARNIAGAILKEYFNK